MENAMKFKDLFKNSQEDSDIQGAICILVACIVVLATVVYIAAVTCNH